MMHAIRQFFAELRRRKVYKVAVVYTAVAFVIWQVADIAFPSLNLPENAIGVVLIFTVLGFPIALVLAWAYEIRPEEKSPAAEEPDPIQIKPPAETNSVAVLPFESMSPGKESSYFADGIAEEITNVLASLADLHVTARTSAFMFKGTHVDTREIGRQLGVGYLVEGSVRQAGEIIRITAQLIDTATGYHLWSERFDRSKGDVFEIQDEIASAVAERLSEQVRLFGGSPRPVARSGAMPAYEAYLQGRQLVSRFGGNTAIEAAACFEQSIKLDPDFAAARAGLAEALTLQSIGFQVKPDKETMPLARQQADQAQQLDPSLPSAYLARALVSMFYEWDYPAAKSLFDRAGVLGPNVARVHMWREFYFTYIENDFEAALAENRRAQRLSPLNQALKSREATVNYLFGELEKAESQFRALIDEMPDLAILHTGLADTLTRQGRLDESITVMERALELGGPLVAFMGIMAGIYGLQGSTGMALELLQKLESRSAQGYVSNFWVAIALAGLGDMDAAFATLKIAVAGRDSNLLYLYHVPRSFGFHRDPRFAGVLQAIGIKQTV